MDFSNWFSNERLDKNDEFLKQFKAATGRSPADYVNHHLIECSKLILTEPECKEITIAEIAQEIGYKVPIKYWRKYVYQRN